MWSKDNDFKNSFERSGTVAVIAFKTVYLEFGLTFLVKLFLPMHFDKGSALNKYDH